MRKAAAQGNENHIFRRGKIIVAPNAFKGSLRAVEAAEAITRGVSAVFTDREVVQAPLADGGDGTVECIVRATGGRLFKKKVTGPLGEPVEGIWGLTGDGSTAVVETASASGLALLSRERLDPLKATSYGTGELILEALHSGCRTVFIGLGGSATTDAGAGILQALGVGLLDQKGRPIGRGAAALENLYRFDLAGVPPRLCEVEIILGCDVDNPLYGPHGAAFVYAPQKGAAPDQLPLLDQYLRHFAAAVKRELGASIDRLAGGGAAGGIGAGLAGVLGVRLLPGIETIINLTGLENLFKQGTELVITGEGEINEQSLRGKVPIGISRLACKYGIPVLVLAGRIRLDIEEARKHGVTSMFSIVDGPITLEEAMERAAKLLEDTTRRALFFRQVERRVTDI